MLPYASPRTKPRRRWWRVDWVILTAAVPCGLWICANWGFLLGQPRHGLGKSTSDELLDRIFYGSVLSSLAVILFLIVLWIRLLIVGKRRARRTGY